MIVCVGLNPALDRRVVLRSVELGRVNRSSSVEVSAGGKAANVARAARALGAQVRYIGFLGGYTGATLGLGLGALGVEVDAVTTAAPTRMNFALADDHGITEVLEPGSSPSASELAELKTRCRLAFQACGSNGVAAFSGSMPQGLNVELYAELIELARIHGLHVILDTSAPWLAPGLAARPDWIKPNREEAEALLARPLEKPTQAAAAVRELVARGPDAAIITLGADGLVGLAGRSVLMVTPPAVEVRSTVGCGDATVAGLAVALERGYSSTEQLVFAAACGVANCAAPAPGGIDAEFVELLRREMHTLLLD